MRSGALSVASRSFLADPPSGFTEVPLLKRRGNLTVARADEEALLDAQLADGRAHVPRHVTDRPGRGAAHGARAPARGGCRCVHRARHVRDRRRCAVQWISPWPARGGRSCGDQRPEPRDRQRWRCLVGGHAGRAIQRSQIGERRRRLGGSGGRTRRRKARQPRAPSAHRPDHRCAGQHKLADGERRDGDAVLQAGCRAADGLPPADATPCEPCDAQPEELDIAIAMDRLQQVTTLDVRHVFRRWGRAAHLRARSLARGGRGCGREGLHLASRSGWFRRDDLARPVRNRRHRGHGRRHSTRYRRDEASLARARNLALHRSQQAGNVVAVMAQGKTHNRSVASGVNSFPPPRRRRSWVCRWRC